MRVLFTHEGFSSQVHGGTARYFAEIVKGVKGAGGQAEIVCGLYVNGYLTRVHGVRGIRVSHRPGRGPANWIFRHGVRALNDLLGALIVRAGKETVIHHTGYESRMHRAGVKTVLTVHDMIHERFPEYFHPRDRTVSGKRRLCREVDRVIAVSHTTKRDLLAFCGIPEEKVVVVHHGNPLEGIAPSPPVRQGPPPYILYVGSRSGYKNFGRLIRVYARSRRLRGNFALVCFGGGPFTASERELLVELRIEGLVTQVGGGDALLARYYLDARVCVCPSLYEGFGMTLLEAMGLGCPLVCSRGGAIPEVAGDAAAYFDGLDPADMQEVLEETLLDGRRLRSMAERGLLRERTFGWERAVEETCAVYRSLVP